MHETYDNKKHGVKRTRVNTKPPDPDDQSPRCRGCPYPRHGLFCRTDSENCLRTEMQEIYNRGRRLEAAPI